MFIEKKLNNIFNYKNNYDIINKIYIKNYFNY